MISRSSAPAIAAEAGALKRTAGTGGSGRTFSAGSREKYGPTDPEPHGSHQTCEDVQPYRRIQVSLASTLGTAPP
jgi:hypothetical protein